MIGNEYRLLSWQSREVLKARGGYYNGFNRKALSKGAPFLRLQVYIRVEISHLTLRYMKGQGNVIKIQRTQELNECYLLFWYISSGNA